MKAHCLASSACLMEMVIVISLDAPPCSSTSMLGGFVKQVKPTRAAEHTLGKFNSPDSSCENARQLI